MKPPGLDWDDDKSASNQKKHGVSFGEAVPVFFDPHAILEYDDEHSETEDRYRLIGMSTHPRILLVVYTERGTINRIISVRKANRHEQQKYEQNS